MNSKTEKFLTRVGMLAVVALVALPLTALAQEVQTLPDGTVQMRIERDRGNQDSRSRDRNRDNDEWRRRRAAEEAQRQRQIEAARRQREIEEARRQRDHRDNDWRGNRGNDDRWGRDDSYNRNRRGRNWDRYGSFGGSFQLRQTALNAGYNNGIQEGRKDRSRGDRFNYRDEGDYQSATEDYSSRLGNRELYRRYFREGFANGYEDGYRGY